jgi:hypothetical protein
MDVFYFFMHEKLHIFRVHSNLLLRRGDDGGGACNILLFSVVRIKVVFGSHEQCRSFDSVLSEFLSLSLTPSVVMIAGKCII